MTISVFATRSALQDTAHSDGGAHEPSASARRPMNPRLLFIGAIIAVLIATLVFKMRVFVLTGKYVLVLVAIVVVIALLAPKSGKR